MRWRRRASNIRRAARSSSANWSNSSRCAAIAAQREEFDQFAEEERAARRMFEALRRQRIEDTDAAGDASVARLDAANRSEQRRIGKECVCTDRSLVLS